MDGSQPEHGTDGEHFVRSTMTLPSVQALPNDNEGCTKILLPNSKKDCRRKKFALIGAISVALVIIVTITLALSFHGKENKKAAPGSKAVTGKGSQNAAGSSNNDTLQGGEQNQERRGTNSFQTTQELYEAVDRWLSGQNTTGTQLATLYGYPIGQWDVSNIADFSNLFYSTRNARAATFNDDISMWNVSSAKNMSGMFAFAYIFAGDLSQWDVSGATNTSMMFHSAYAFDADLSTWDVSNVQDMSSMFFSTSSLRGSGLENWDVSTVTNMQSTFAFATAFDQDLSNWDVSQVNNMDTMFYDAQSFTGVGLTSWDVSHVTKMGGMFQGATVVNEDLSNWNVSKVIAMQAMFSKTEKFNQDLSSWDVSNVQDMNYMFGFAVAFDQDLCEWGTRVLPTANTAMAFTASGCPVNGNFDDPDLSSTPPGPFCHECT